MNLTRSIEGIFLKKTRRDLDFPLIQISYIIIEVKWLKTVYVMLKA